MRVLHLATSGWNPREGIARAVQAIVERVPAEHHLLATGADGPMFAVTHELGGGPSPLPWSRRLAQVLAETEPDVVHLHGGVGAAGVAMGLSGGRRGVVVSVYGRLGHPSWRDPNFRRDLQVANMSMQRRLVVQGVGMPLLRHALRSGRVGAVCSPDRGIVEELRGWGPVVLTQGAAQPSARRAQWSDRPLIAFAGRAEAGRGVDDLLVASLLVRRRRPDARFLLALLPSPSSRRWQGLSLAGVEIRVGAAADLDDLLAGAQVAALPFRLVASVTPALVAAESMAVGLPVVGTEVGCLRTIVRDHHNGRLVAPANPEQLADALLDTIGRRDAWEAMSANARRTIEEDWHWDNAAAAVSHAYDVARRRATSAAA